MPGGWKKRSGGSSKGSRRSAACERGDAYEQPIEIPSVPALVAGARFRTVCVRKVIAKRASPEAVPRARLCSAPARADPRFDLCAALAAIRRASPRGGSATIGPRLRALRVSAASLRRHVPYRRAEVLDAQRAEY